MQFNVEFFLFAVGVSVLQYMYHRLASGWSVKNYTIGLVVMMLLVVAFVLLFM